MMIKKILFSILVIILVPSFSLAYNKTITCDEFANFKIKSTDFDKLNSVNCTLVDPNQVNLSDQKIVSPIYNIQAKGSTEETILPRSEYEFIFSKRKLNENDSKNLKVYFFDDKSQEWVTAQTEDKGEYLLAKGPINGKYAVFSNSMTINITDKYKQVSILFLIVSVILLLTHYLYSHK